MDLLRSALSGTTAILVGLLALPGLLPAQMSREAKISARVSALLESEEFVPVLISLSEQPHRTILSRMHQRLAARTSLNLAGDDDDALIRARQDAARELQSALAPQQVEIASRLRMAGARQIHPYYIQNLIAAEVPRTALPLLESDPAVVSVRPVRRFTASLYVSVPAL